MGPRPELSVLLKRSRRKDARLESFLRDHYDALTDYLGTSRVDRKALMLLVEEGSFTNEHGKPLATATAAETWKRVRTQLCGRAKREAPTRRRGGAIAPDVIPPVEAEHTSNASIAKQQALPPTPVTAIHQRAPDTHVPVRPVEGESSCRGMTTLERMRAERADKIRAPPPVLKSVRM